MRNQPRQIRKPHTMDRGPTTEIAPPGPPPAPVAMLAPGTEVGGRYLVRQRLGSGGFATVYRAFDRELEREVALKVLRADRLSAATLRRFRREAALARDASGSRLARIYDIGAHGRTLFLTMEIAAGGSLAGRLAAGPLAVEEAVRIASQVLEGLQALHVLKIVHRDIKPGNLLLTGDGAVKLADFGLARQLGSDETRLTQDDALLGTLQYLSPEQALGGEADERSDLYALGVVLFEMLAGRLPHAGRSPLGTLLGHIQHEAPEVRQWRPEVPDWLAAVVARLLAREPQRRYPSAAAVLADLAARTSPGGGPGRGTQEPRSGATFGGLGGLAGLGALLLALAGGLGPAPAPDDFPHFEQLPGGGTAAVSPAGVEMWRDLRAPPGAFVRARLRRGAPPSLLGIRDALGSPEDVHKLEVLDPRTGRPLRAIPLRGGAHLFPQFEDSFSPVLAAVDLDGDGVDEVLITYQHRTWWPCYTVLYEPRLGRSRIVYASSGHHFFAGAADLEGKGRNDLLFAGINNRLGWYTAIAAVRPAPPVNELAAEKALAGSPDAYYSASSASSLLWFALGPPNRFADSGPRCRVDLAHRRIDCDYMDGVQLALGFDGMPVGSPGVASSRGVARQWQARAYREVREALRLLDGQNAAEALPVAERACLAASRSRDERLLDWTRRLRARALVSTGEAGLGPGQAAFEELWRTSEAASDVAFEAGRALHETGRPALAIRWYRRSLGRGATDEQGRGKWEALQNEVLALTELGRLSEAPAEIERFAHLYPGYLLAADVMRRYGAWRSGETPPAEGLQIGDDGPEFWRYVVLELRFASRAEPRALLGAVAADERRRTAAAPELMSLEAEVLARLGRRSAAARVALEALRLARATFAADMVVRAQLPLIEERAHRLARAGERVSAAASSSLGSPAPPGAG